MKGWFVREERIQRGKGQRRGGEAAGGGLAVRGSVRGREAARGVGVRTDGIGKSSWDPAGARILRNLTSLIPVGNRAPLKKTRKDVVHKIITHDGGDRSDPMNNKGRRGTRGYERGPDWGSWDIPGERAIVVDARVFRARKRQERGVRSRWEGEE